MYWRWADQADFVMVERDGRATEAAVRQVVDDSERRHTGYYNGRAQYHMVKVTDTPILIRHEDGAEEWIAPSRVSAIRGVYSSAWKWVGREKKPGSDSMTQIDLLDSLGST